MAAPAIATPAANTGTGTAPPSTPTLTPEAELAKIQSDPTFAGGKYYGRVPNGIADLVNGGIVKPPAPTPAATGANAAGQPGEWVVGADGINKFQPAPDTTKTAIDSSGVRRYTGSATPGAPSIPNDGTPGSAPVQKPDVNAIRASAMADSTAEIDAIKNSGAQEIAQAQQEGVSNLGKGRAVESRSGILGSDFGIAQQDTIQKGTDTKVAAINEKINAAIAAVMSKAQSRGDTLAQQAIQNADKESADYQANLKAHADSARADIVSLAKSGVPIDSLNQTEYNTLVEQSGYTPEVFDAVYNSQLPQNQKRTYTYQKIGNSIVPVYTDPVTQQPVVGNPITPPGGDTTKYDGFMVAPDGTPIFYNKTTGAAEVANVSGATKTNFAKPPAPAKPGKTPTPPASQVKNDKLGKSWLQGQPNFTQSDLDKYNSDPVFHEKVNNAAIASTKVKSSGSSGSKRALP